MAWVDPTIKSKTELRPDGTPVNFAGGAEAYQQYKTSEAQRKQANLDWNTGSGGRLETLAQTGYDIGSRYGGGSSGASSYNPYQSALDAANRALQARVQQGKQTLEAQIPTLNQTYDDIARQGYANYRQQQTKLPSQLSGLATGTADSLTLQGRLGFENAQAQTERERANALTGIQSDIANLQTTGDIQLAENASQYALMAEQYRQQMEQEMYNRSLTERQWQNQQEQQEYERTLAERAYANSLNKGTEESKPSASELRSLYQMYMDYGDVDRAAYIGRMLDEMFGGSTASQSQQATVANRHGDGWIEVGGARIGLDGLQAGIQNGTIVAIRNSDGSITYRRA